MRTGTRPVRVTIGGAWGRPLATMASAGSPVKRVIEPDHEPLNSKVTPHLDVPTASFLFFGGRERGGREQKRTWNGKKKKHASRSRTAFCGHDSEPCLVTRKAAGRGGRLASAFNFHSHEIGTTCSAFILFLFHSPTGHTKETADHCSFPRTTVTTSHPRARLSRRNRNNALSLNLPVWCWFSCPARFAEEEQKVVCLV